MTDTMMQRISGLVGGFKRSSALAPGISLCWPCVAALVYLYSKGISIPGYLEFVLALPILTVVGLFVYFAIKDPNRLHSEQHQIRQKALDLIQDKGQSPSLLTSVVAIANPDNGRQSRTVIDHER